MDDILGNAVKLRSSMAKQDRIVYDKSPKYLRHSLFFHLNIEQPEKVSFEEKLAIALKCKNEGNDMIKIDLYQAMNKYEEALAQFDYYELKVGKFKSVKEFKTTGVRDNDIRLVKTEETSKEKENLIASVLCNLALCYLKLSEEKKNQEALKELKEVVRTCSTVLEKDIESDSILSKIYYRRSLATLRLYSIKVRGYEYDSQDTTKLLLQSYFDVKSSLSIKVTKQAKALLQEIALIRENKAKEPRSNFSFKNQEIVINAETESDELLDDKKVKKELWEENRRVRIKKLEDDLKIYKAFHQKLIKEKRFNDRRKVDQVLRNLKEELLKEKTKLRIGPPNSFTPLKKTYSVVKTEIKSMLDKPLGKLTFSFMIINAFLFFYFLGFLGLEVYEAV